MPMDKPKMVAKGKKDDGAKNEDGKKEEVKPAAEKVDAGKDKKKGKK